MYSVGRSNAGITGASAAMVSSVASRSGTASASLSRIACSSATVGTFEKPPGITVVGCVVRPPMSEPHSCASRLRRRARATTSACVGTSANADGAPRRSGATST